MDKENLVIARIRESINTKEKILNDQNILLTINKVAEIMINSIESDGTIYVCGNGGSASDSLHMAGELVGRFKKERRACACISLNADVASMTAIANDYGYDQIFKRAIEAFANSKDVVVGISTSGNSKNIFDALKKANDLGATSIGLLGKDGGRIKTIAKESIIVPSEITAHIQEAHITIIHILCELIEEVLN